VTGTERAHPAPGFAAAVSLSPTEPGSVFLPHAESSRSVMKLLILLVAWCILLVLCWPLALLLLVLAPLLWLLALPFRFALLCVEGVFALLRALLLLPVRLLGGGK
jgi:hypothetical protein